MTEPVAAARRGPEHASPGTLPAEAYAVALAGLPGMGPRRLSTLLDSWGAAEAWQRVCDGRAAVEPARVIRETARKVDVVEVWRATVAAGLNVHVLGSPGYPPVLAGDHEAPAVLFSRGDIEAVCGRRVAIVGTRRCTHYGLDFARELGRDLALAGVRVVSGLALGVDGAAHAGAIEAAAAPPIGVVAGGLDIVYPRRHARLWESVAGNGLLLSEAPLGIRPEKWRFPVRNRVIAALAEVVVVVESHVKGGSHYTVLAAEERGLTVMAVPGSVRSPASAYTNGLLADGCPPVRDCTDVLVALGLSTATSGGSGARPDTRRAPEGADARLLETMGWEPATFEQVVARSGVGPAEAGVALAHLERDRWIVSAGGWWRRVPN